MNRYLFSIFSDLDDSQETVKGPEVVNANLGGDMQALEHNVAIAGVNEGNTVDDTSNPGDNATDSHNGDADQLAVAGPSGYQDRTGLNIFCHKNFTRIMLRNLTLVK